MRYFIFLDESGDHGLINVDPNFPVFVLCGILIEESKYYVFRDELNKIKTQIWGDKQVILHSRDIRKCEKEFSKFFDIDVKAWFYEHLNKLISETDFKIISSAIKKDLHIKKYGRLNQNVYEIALSFLIERAIFCVDSFELESANIQAVIEKRGKKEDKELNRHFQRLKSNGTYYVSKERMAMYGMGFHFRNKKENVNGLQLADLIAYPIARYIINPNRANPAYELIEEKFYSRNGIKHGLKVFP